jgi:hypothetical protein
MSERASSTCFGSPPDSDSVTKGRRFATIGSVAATSAVHSSLNYCNRLRYFVTSFISCQWLPMPAQQQSSSLLMNATVEAQ